MGRTTGTEAILDVASTWRDRCFLADGSMFSNRTLWTREHLAELTEHFIEKPDTGDRTFLEKLRDQLGPTTAGAKQLAAEMLWVLLLFPNNITRDKKVDTIATVWRWSGEPFSLDHPALTAMGIGIGSGGQAYNTFRPLELQFFIRLMQDWKALPEEEQYALALDAWACAAWIDAVEGGEKRQFRHMLLHLLFPDSFERVSSGNHKALIDAAFSSTIDASTLQPDEAATTLVARDRRLFRVREALQRDKPASAVDFYYAGLSERWRPESVPDSKASIARPLVSTALAERRRAPEDVDGHAKPRSLGEIQEALQTLGLRVSERLLRRYHLALESRGFVILSGVSGAGKTWLAEAYAQTTGARWLVVPVAPNWTTNEDLLGFADPLNGHYRDTAFSRFLREAAGEHDASRKAGRSARPFHLVLDEMNLARVEYYFATFLSAMELRTRSGEARIELGPEDGVMLPSNLKFIGTVNVDETTHGFADKVHDRAHVIEMDVPRDALETHLGGAPYRDELLAVWDALKVVAPFAFRVLDDAGKYITSAGLLGVSWEEPLDDVILQKILPKIRGTDPRVGDALSTLDPILASRFPLSHAKVMAMKAAFEQHGVASYF